MLVSIITLNFKKPERTIACLESLYTHFKSELKDSILEVIVIDNKSPDDSVKILKEEIEKKKYRNIKLYQNHENAGFGSGNNFGATKAKGEFLLFLNNDTIVKDKGILDMIAFMDKNKDIAILGGQLHNLDGSLQPSTGKFYTLFNAFLLLIGMQRFGLLDKSPGTISQVDWVKGAIMMIRKKIFEELGGFDPKIFMYIEDMELCFRARQKKYKTYFYPYIQVVHQDQGSTNRTFAIVNIYQNLLYFYKKHQPYSEYLLLKGMLVLKAHLLRQYGKITHNGYLTTTYEQALKAIR